MKNSVMLTITSLLSILLFTFHITGDIVRGFEKGDLSNFGAVPIAALWLYAAVVLAGRRSGYIIVLLYSLLSVGVPYLHMRGKGVGIASGIATSSGGFFFIWTLIAIGVLGLFSLVLSVHGLWSLPWRRPR